MSEDDPPNSVSADPPSPELARLKDNPSFMKLVETVNRLSEYSDFTPEFLENFPKNLPCKFALKLGPNIIGYAVIDWRAVGGKLLDALTLKPKPEELSEEEYFQLLRDYIESLSAKEQFQVLLPSFSAMWHMLEHMPKKMHDALVQLAMEGRQKVIIKQQRELGKSVPSPAKFAEQLAKIEKDAIKSRLPKLKPTKTKPAWQNADNLRGFAERVMVRQLLCQCMKNVYDRCDFLDDWADDLRHDEQFRLLSSEVSQEAITWAIRQIGDDRISPRDRETVLVACEIARRELDLPFQEIQTLRGYYQEGTRLLRADRNKRKAVTANGLPSAPSTRGMDGADSAPPTLDIDSAHSE